MTPNPTSSGLGLALLTLSSAIMIFLAKRIKPIRLLASTLKLSSSSQMETSNNAMSQYWLKRDHENNFLEEVLGDKALSWVREQNAKCMVAVGNPESSPLYNRILGILDSKDKIPYITKIGNNYYNFWQDAQNKKGILRRTTLESFKTVSPEWVTVLDVDALAAAEGENWVYKGYSLLTEDDSTIEPSLILLSLSRAGADATVVREFNLSTGSFVPNGFYVPESKSRVSWKSRDVLFIGTDLKDGNSLTDSGYPRTVREWKRGTKLEDSTLLFAGQKTDVAVSANLAKHRGFKIEVFSRSVTFYTSEYSVALVSGPKSGVGFSSSVVRTTLNIPDFVKLGFFADQLLLTLRKSWNVGGREYPAGSLLATSLTDFLAKQGTIDSGKICYVTSIVSLIYLHTYFFFYSFFLCYLRANGHCQSG